MIDKLIKLVRKGFEGTTHTQRNNKSYALADLLSTGFATFFIKRSSLTSFREQYLVREENLWAMLQVCAT
jgi:hypothetical protein